jgi:hypothetical protein
MLRKILSVLVVTFLVIGLCVVFHFAQSIPPGPRGNIPAKGYDSAMCLQVAYYLRLYALDHHGHFPEGKTSTEVFQRLIDENYVDDLDMFGKPPPEGQRLKPENVRWDVTCCVDSSAPDGLPLVFSTGYKVTYQPGSPAVPLKPPQKTWIGWWNRTNRPFITVVSLGYKAPHVTSTKVWDEITKTYSIFETSKDGSQVIFDAAEDGSIPNFIPSNFDPKGKTYRQLTP